MPQYKHLFFDLDHTLWDFDANAKASLADLYTLLDLDSRIKIPKGMIQVEKKMFILGHCFDTKFSSGKIPALSVIARYHFAYKYYAT